LNVLISHSGLAHAKRGYQSTPFGGSAIQFRAER
jgi:hypothetical protein